MLFYLFSLPLSPLKKKGGGSNGEETVLTDEITSLQNKGYSGFPLRNLRFNLSWPHNRFVVDQVAMEQIFLQLFCFHSVGRHSTFT